MEGLTVIWRPVGVGRHAFWASDREKPPDATVLSRCGGVEVEAWRLQRKASKLEWITEQTCMTCWRVLAESQ